MLQHPLHSFFAFEANLIIPSGNVTTFAEKVRVNGPVYIAMNHKANCFYVATNSAHTITKITSPGTSKASFLFFFSSLLVEHAG